MALLDHTPTPATTMDKVCDGVAILTTIGLLAFLYFDGGRVRARADGVLTECRHGMPRKAQGAPG